MAFLPNTFTEDVVKAFIEQEGAVLGRGLYRDVFLGRMGDVQVAIKRYRNDSTSANHMYANEVRNMNRNLDHENIVRYYGNASGEYNYTVFQFIAGGNLAQRMAEPNLLNWRQIVRVLQQIASGLSYLGDLRNFEHGNIQPNNICLTDDLQPIIIDFEQMIPTVAGYSVQGCGNYHPKNYETEQASGKGDKYGFGVILCQLVMRTQETSFQGVIMPTAVRNAFHNRDTIVNQALRQPNDACNYVDKRRITLAALKCFGKEGEEPATWASIKRRLDSLTV
ncbi:putative Kinase [Quillaja saponaria]|uniref:Kinase n=1 Tax=Quillaja saponaria TaxID=32244 RepID=A0AAD7L120_QUISA|nr:putative Kinase [Quillaja saponaria]